MRRPVLYLIAVILVALAVGAFFVAAGSKNNDDKKSTAASTKSNDQSAGSGRRKACNIFTLADAKQLLGDTAKGGSTGINTSSNDIAVSTCTYSQDAGSNAPVSGNKSATLLERTPKTAKGISSNQNQFGSFKPVDVQDVTGYGEAAYWDAEHGQLNVLKNNTWYILSYGSVAPADRTLDEAKQLADLLINKM